MLKILKIQSSGALSFLTPYLNVLPGEVDQHQVAEGLKSLLLSYPQQCCFFAALDDETEYCGAFVLAFCETKSECRILQLFVDPKCQKTTLTQLLWRVVLWCDQNDIPSVVVSTARVEEKLVASLDFHVTTKLYALDVGGQIGKVLEAGAKVSEVTAVTAMTAVTVVKEE